MKSDKLEKLFEDIDFDVAKPETGHKDRFFEKLQKTKPAQKRPKPTYLWAPFAGVAAAIAVIFMLLGNILNPAVFSKSGDLSSVSPEMKETRDFYTAVIQNELNQIEDAKTPETEAIIDDALLQLQKLEVEYEQLKDDLIQSGQDNRVIYAMISNFQQRIDLLNGVLMRIKDIKSLKEQNDENNIL